MTTSRMILILATSSGRHSTKMYGGVSHIPVAILQYIQEGSTVIEAYKASSSSVHPVMDLASVREALEAGVVDTEVSPIST